MGADRISALPDDILHHILSFLDTQHAIKATYILSKRWTNLWTSIPSLIFHYPSFSCPHSDRRERCFRRFIKRVLSHRRMRITPLSKVKKLSLCFVNEPLGWNHVSEELLDTQRFETEDRFLFKLLFFFAALNDVEELCIEGGFMDFSDWYPEFLTCRSLKLSGYFDTVWIPYSFDFLKSLEIENFYAYFYFDLEGDVFLPTYPLLERLILRGSCFERVCICAPKLEYLEMETITSRDERFGREIVLSTPKLASVKLDDVVPILISTDDFLCLDKVEFSLSFSPLIPDDDVMQDFVERLRSVLNLLQKANSITIDSVALEVLSELIEEGIMFEKLKHLRLRYGVEIDRPNHMLSCMLSSPSLEEWHVEDPFRAVS